MRYKNSQPELKQYYLVSYTMHQAIYFQQRDSINYGTLEAEHKSKMNNIKSQKEATAREKYLEQDKYKRGKGYLNAINTAIDNDKDVKDKQSKVDSLKNSGRYYATAGALNEAGLKRQKEINDKMAGFRQDNELKSQAIQKKKKKKNAQNLVTQQAIDNKAKSFAEGEKVIEDRSKEISDTISRMKANNTYYELDANGKIKEINGKAVLTEAAQKEEDALAFNNEKLSAIRNTNESIIAKEREDLKKEQEKQQKEKENEEKQLEEDKKRQEEEIKTAQEELDKDEDMKYKEGEMTAEGKAADEELTKEKKIAYDKLKISNENVQEAIKNIEKMNKEERESGKPEKDQVIIQLEDKDSFFNKSEIYRMDEAIGSIEQKYEQQEAKYEEDERIETIRFNNVVKEKGIDPSSDSVLAHKADDASHHVNTKEAPGTQMSARTVDRSTFTRYTNEWTYNGPEGGGPRHHDTPPPPPPHE